ncbi:MAG: BatA domain-containing protein [Planctomycetota bacterium]
MSFLHITLLAGMAAVTVPIMMHLFGQRQPQLIDFPALRFVKETRQEQSTSWQLRHFLLLLLRILMLAMLALAVARPRVHSSTLNSIFSVSAVGLCAALATIVALAALAGKRQRSILFVTSLIALVLWGITAWWGVQSLSSSPPPPTADDSAPVAAVIIVDNSPTMAYRFNNTLRLDSAKEEALWVLEKLPDESKVAVLVGAPVSSLGLDPSTAKAQVQLLETRAAHVDLLSRLRTAIDLVLKNELERKEVYILTDMMSPAWSSSQPGLKELLDEHRSDVLVQIIDVGLEDQANWSLGDPKVNAESVVVGGDIEVEVLVTRPDSVAGNSNNLSVTVELLREGINPRLPIVRAGKLETAPSAVVDRKVIDLSSKASSLVKLRANELPEGVHHFTIQIDKTDPLAIDNQRFFSIEARPVQPTLILADDPDLAEMLQFVVGDPDTGISDTIRFAQLNQTPLGRYALLWLHDPPPMSEQNATKLQEFVEQGGSVLLVLGPAIGTTDSIQGNGLAKLFPGPITELKTRDIGGSDSFLTPIALSHPMFQDWGDEITDQVWNRFSIYNNWHVSEVSDNASVVMQLSDDNSPAILSENRGKGQILTFTTPVPDFATNDRPLWNNLWSTDDPYEAFSLLYGGLASLYGASRESLNHSVSVPISLRNDEAKWPSRYELYLPNAKTKRVQANEGNLDVGSFEQAGIYRLRGLRGDPISRGFSINAPSADTALQRVSAPTVLQQLGEENVRIASNRDEVESSVGQARFGRELYPLLMLFVAGLFLAEQAMSNLFYKIKFR